MTNEQRQELKKCAIVARTFSHSPYSNFKLGCAVLTSTGKIFTGTNLENASLGATVCAERVAIWKSQSEETSRITVVVLYIEVENVWTPCGMCRQVMAEFAEPSAVILAFNHLGQEKTWTFAELLPDSFVPGYLGGG